MDRCVVCSLMPYQCVAGIPYQCVIDRESIRLCAAFTNKTFFFVWKSLPPSVVSIPVPVVELELKQ